MEIKMEEIITELSISAVNDAVFSTLNLDSLIIQQQKEIVSITQVSNSKTISSLGDVRVFLTGFNNGDNLHDTLDGMNKEMLRFEQTG